MINKPSSRGWGFLRRKILHHDNEALDPHNLINPATIPSQSTHVLDKLLFVLGPSSRFLARTRRREYSRFLNRDRGQWTRKYGLKGIFQCHLLNSIRFHILFANTHNATQTTPIRRQHRPTNK